MRRTKWIPPITFLLIPCLHAVAQKENDLLTIDDATEVVLLLDTGEEIEGELHSLRDSALVISVADKFSDGKPATLHVVEHDNIHTVTIKGTSHVYLGTGAGVGVGLVAAAMYVDLEDDELSFEHMGEQILVGAFERPRTFIAFALGGAILGAVAGMTTSDSDKQLITPTRRDFSSLKPFARFPLEEPRSLLERE